MQFRQIDVILMLAVMATLPAAHAADSGSNTLSGAKIAEESTTGQYVDDATITTKVKTALLTDSLVSAFQIKVDTERGVVTLSGTVDKPETVQRAVRLAAAVPGVKSVKAQLQTRTASN